MATATMVCRVQFLDDTDPFNSTNFPEPTRPPLYSFREDIPLVTQLAGVHRLLKAPQKLDDCALQLSHNGTYLDLESTLAEQKDELESFQGEFGRGKKHSIILRTQLSVRVHACIEKLYNSNGRELRRALFSLKQIFQDDKDLVHEFVVAEGLACLIKVGAEADQNYQNYILRALGQIMLYVDGMNGVINHNETIQWLYILIGSKFRLVVKTALKLLLVFVEYTESNSSLLIEAVATVDAKRGFKLWSSVMEILEEKDGLDTELLVYAMTLINKTLSGLPDQDSFYDVIDCLEELGMEIISRKHLNKKGSDLDLVEQFNIYEMTLRHEDGDDSGEPLPIACKDRRRTSLGSNERRGLERRKSRRHSIQSVKNTLSAPASPCTHSSPNFMCGHRQSTEEYSEKEKAYDEEEEQPVIESGTEDEREEKATGQVNASGFSEIQKVKHAPQNFDTSVISSVISQDERLSRNCRTNISNSSSSLDSVALHPFPHHSSSSSSVKVTSPNSSCVTPKTSPNVEKLPYVPYSPFHLFSYDVEEPQTAMREKEEEFRENRTSLGGLLTSSYRQHQESLAVERERRRQEREERLQRIEREERNKFNQNYLDKREELRQAREERYKHLEKLAAEEYEKELKNRNLSCDRNDLSLNLGGSSIPTVTIPKCASPGSTDSLEKPSACVTSCITSQILEVNASQPECEPEPEAKKKTKSELEDETKFNQGTETTLIAVKGAEVEVGREPEREEGALSEKERQNEDLNEKDNCSASSLSSASSTLEREEPEQKLSNKDKAGPCLQSIQDDDVNDQYNNILNNKRFMLDMLYAHNNLPFTKDERVKELEAKIDIKKVLNASEDTDISLHSRISVLQTSKQAKDECLKKMEIGSLENQGNVKIFTERFNSGDVAKISNLSENDFNEKIPEKIPLQVKTESDFIWDQLLASPRKLKIKDMDFTDLGDEDDIDILDIQISPSDALVPPPPPIPSVLGFPPPPPPLLYRCPLPPPPFGNLLAPCLSSTPQSLGSAPLPRDQANFIKKKKTIRLFWNEVRPFEWQCKKNRHCKGFLWSKLEPIKVDTAKLEHLFETKSKDLPITKKTAADGKRQEIIVLDSKRSNAINIGLTVLPHPRTIKVAILNFDEYALNKEGIEKILTMIPTEEEKQKIQEAQLANPDIPLGTAEQFLLTLSSITELTPRLQLWAFKMDYELVEKALQVPEVEAPVATLASPTPMVASDVVDNLKAEDKRTELALRKTFLVATWVIKAASSASFFNHATLMWLEQMQERVLAHDVRLLQDISKVIAATKFSADATLKFASMALSSSVSARRMVCLWNLQADAKAKWKLAAGPYVGKKLFGEVLDPIFIENKNKCKALPVTTKKQEHKYTPYTCRAPYRVLMKKLLFGGKIESDKQKSYLKHVWDKMKNGCVQSFQVQDHTMWRKTKAFELSYLEKVPEVKDTVHKQSLLHHVCTIVVETFPDSTDLYSEIGAVTRSAKVDFEQLQDNLCQMEKRCKASWDHLKAIAKHEMKSTLKQKMSEFLKDCAERIIILKIVHRRIINRFHSFLLFMGYPLYAIREININKFCKIISEFALEYRTTRERVLQQKQKRANHRERNKTRGKMITDTDEEDDIESGKFSSSSPTPHNQLQGLQDTEDAVEHENMKAVLKISSPTGENIALGIRTRSRANQGYAGSWNPSNDDLTNATDNAADEIMDRIVKSATQVPSQRVVPKERKRSRANRKSIRRTLKSGLSPEEAKALGLMGTSEMQV
ncbi:PREDICTED: FH1/FH2 domain-containing protein 3 [Thamnophis sirtalis]|uniref:FH1/FH2 domain-containing protein 3 n=1 Tax=Thamnophis sirtalis TaxID=35019 RepID=A0A6I9Y4A0_9SAUR|nr:PREDICTED: FH1/FH2 domain-containing protein 3 [Thamnophis sirtalis]